MSTIRSHPGHGAGGRLVAALEAGGAARGLEEMAVRSNVTRAEAHPLYERLGYLRVRTSHIYRKPIPTESW